MNARDWFDATAVDSDPTPPRGTARPSALRVHPVDLRPGDVMQGGWRVASPVFGPNWNGREGLVVSVFVEHAGRRETRWWPLSRARRMWLKVYRSTAAADPQRAAVAVPASTRDRQGVEAGTIFDGGVA